MKHSDEEYVRSVWDFGQVGIYGYGGTAKYLNFSAIGKEVMGANREQMWENAAEFTRERLEQVRQLRREIEWCMGNLLSAKSWSKYTAIMPPERLGEWAREETTIGRILASREAELARLAAGMKPETV